MQQPVDQKTSADYQLVENDQSYFLRRKLFLQLFGLVGGGIILFYAFVNLIVADYWAFAVELCAGSAMVVALYLVSRTEKSELAVNIALVAGTVIIWQNFYSSGFDGTGVYWVFMAPLLIFFLAGTRKAIFWNIILYLGLILLFLAMQLGIITNHYSQFGVGMMFIALTVFSLVIYFYQRGLERYLIELVTKREQLDSQNRVRERFVKIVTDQFRSPIALTYQQIMHNLNKDELPVEVRESLESVRQPMRDINRRIEEMLVAMQIQANETSLERQETDIPGLLRKELEIYRGQYAHQHVEVALVNIDDKQVAEVDPQKMQMVFRVLIDNAFTYTQVDKKISIVLSKQEDNLRLEITDEGIGIPSTDQWAIGELFSRGGNSAQMDPDGIGVGLYVAKQFVLAHKGKFSFLSAEGKGSTFKVEFPIKQAG
ncbi:HAMP domain-containing histidine kinase [Candidatus Dojkabacteria bacterium]|uniref:histidine kinase n=1 Tax=Candidatus Dojkabacteria bacterium TaxID=2099670 RepID=A0A955I6U3_9BACT|nr:HAMP domain-containing histidine kinase [Candidatus Dojkabacteria bacterium]